MDFEHKIITLKNQSDFFSSPNPIYISRAPGRIDLMGGNDDYTGGLVFEATIAEATYAASQLNHEMLVVLKNKNAQEAGWLGEYSIDINDLTDEIKVREIVNASPSVRWTAYVLGNIFYLKMKYPEQVNKGIRIYMESTVPLNRGVSSSAAIEVAVMKASAAAYGINLSGTQLALACQWVENVIAESACGIMDQITVISGLKDYILPLVCQPCNPEPLIKLPNDLKVWAIDSGVSHQVSGIEYESARAAAFMGYKMICDNENIEVIEQTENDIKRFTDSKWNGYLANVSPSIFESHYRNILPQRISGMEYIKNHSIHVDPFTQVRDDIHYNVLANTKYAVEENNRVNVFSELSRGASTQRAYSLMGELMYQSHWGYTECGLGAKATDILVGICREAGINQGIYGAKITGGGAGGTVAILADKNASAVIYEIFSSYKELNLGIPYLFEGSSDGADAYGIKII